MSRDDRFETQQMAILFEQYREEKEQAREGGWPNSVTMRKFERKHHIKAGSLIYFAANHIYRK